MSRSSSKVSRDFSVTPWTPLLPNRLSVCLSVSSSAKLSSILSEHRRTLRRAARVVTQKRDRCRICPWNRLALSTATGCAQKMQGCGSSCSSSSAEEAEQATCGRPIKAEDIEEEVPPDSDVTPKLTSKLCAWLSRRYSTEQNYETRRNHFEFESVRDESCCRAATPVVGHVAVFFQLFVAMVSCVPSHGGSRE